MQEELLRLFYGVRLPEPVREEVVTLQQRLAAASDAGVKWVEASNLHLTLRFLGEQPKELVKELATLGHALATEIRPWEMVLAGVGAFPDLRRPQVIWIGVKEGAAPLIRLAQRLSERLEDKLILGAETKSFRPHCTLGRVKQPRGLRRLIAALEAEQNFTCQKFCCDGFQLFASVLRPEGPIYTILAEFSLSGR